MQIPLRASGSSEIFPGTLRRPDQTESHYWPYGQERNHWQMREKGATEWEKQKKKKKDRGGIFTTWTHTSHPQEESKFQSALQDHSRSQTVFHLVDMWERRRGANRKRWQNKHGNREDFFEYLWSTLNVSVCHTGPSFPLAQNGLTLGPCTVCAVAHKHSWEIYMQVHARGKPRGTGGGRRRTLVWLDNHVPARDKGKSVLWKENMDGSPPSWLTLPL